MDKNVEVCPKCGTKMGVLQRITGYLVGCTDRWNPGKLAELKDRVQHEIQDKK
jgi:ribonucleoside-triphosphate reductase